MKGPVRPGVGWGDRKDSRHAVWGGGRRGHTHRHTRVSWRPKISGKPPGALKHR